MIYRALRTCCVVIASSACAWAQTTSLASVSSSGTSANGTSVFFTDAHRCSISGAGRWVAFESFASNLVPGDANGFEDVFVRDRQTGATELVSQSSAGVGGLYGSRAASISAHGRFVAFQSDSPNLVAGGTDGFHVFVRDRQLGTTELISVDSGGVHATDGSYRPSISADGRFVAFVSAAANLAPGDTNNVYDIFVRDRELGTTERVSVSSTGVQGTQESAFPSISGDGRFVAFHSYANNLVPDDTTPNPDVFVHDRDTDTTVKASISSAGVHPNHGSLYPQISSNGRYVVFYSAATNLVIGDTNSMDDIFIRDLESGTTELASLTSTGGQPNGLSISPVISADGRYVAWSSQANNVVPGDTNAAHDIYLRDRQAGTTTRMSVNSVGTIANNTSIWPAVSGDGRCVAFASQASNLVPPPVTFTYQIYVRDRDPALDAYCFGDGSSTACPCSNDGAPSHGCDNSAATGGAILSATGAASLAADHLVLTSSGELSSALSIVLQGDLSLPAVHFGDGLRCVSGALKRLYAKNAVGGVVSAPEEGDPSISARSAALGDVIPPGASRFYQTYYRDPNLSFCPDPPGNSWNVSSGLAVVWDY